MTTPTQEVATPAEAGFSTNMFLNHPKMGRLQFTFRGATSRDWGVVLEDVDRFLHYMHEKGWKFEGEVVAPEAPAPKPDPAAKIAQEEGNDMLAAALQVQAEAVPASPDGRPWQTFAAVHVKILPQPDDKITIEFYGDDKKKPHNDFAGVKVNKWPIARAQELMRHAADVDVLRAAEYSLPCVVYYLDGKEYTTTRGDKGHYKDVYHLRPA